MVQDKKAADLAFLSKFSEALGKRDRQKTRKMLVVLLIGLHVFA